MNKVSFGTVKQGYKKGFKTIRNSKMFFVKSLFLMIIGFLGNITFYFSGITNNLKHNILSNSLNKSEFDINQMFGVVDEHKTNNNLRVITFLKVATFLMGGVISAIVLYILRKAGVLVNGINITKYGPAEAIVVIALSLIALIFILFINSYYNYAEYIIINREATQTNVIVDYFKNKKIKELVKLTLAKFVNYILTIVSIVLIITIKDTGHVYVLDEIIVIIKVLLLLFAIISFVFSWFINLNISGVCFNKLQEEAFSGEYYVDSLNKEEQLALINLFESSKGDS